MYFAQSVLLVEGPGDREYWEAIRRRVAVFDATGSIDHCYVLDTGSNASFSPWIRILRSYPNEPISWISIMDLDSVSELRRCCTDSGLVLSARQIKTLETIDQAWSLEDFEGAESSSRALSITSANEHPLFLAPIDLEHMLCSRISQETANLLAARIGTVPSNPQEMAEKMGSKRRPGRRAIGSPLKQPWIRKAFGTLTPANELNPLVQTVCERWFGAAGTPRDARRSWNEFVKAGGR